MSETFIFQDKISEKICDKLKNFYKNNINRHIKDKNTLGKLSTEIILTSKDEIYFEYDNHLGECLKKYLKKYERANCVKDFSISDQIKIQHYKINEGFFNWHHENDGFYPDIKRHLVFMTYLNNVDDGGTEFLYQNMITKAIKGNTVIWPSQWTHTHKGQISKVKEKYIITGWFTFNE